jgi:hypothetical protein
MKGHTGYISIYMQCPEWENSGSEEKGNWGVTAVRVEEFGSSF